MPTVRTLSGEVMVTAPRAGQMPAKYPAQERADERIVIEDGWVFREHHGKYVECICRSDEILPLHGHEDGAAHRC
ncbi:hypothetical protein [Acidocella sp.]|uniref:hypothetical protein n=1 Tax=Acidocella sp. TaxID=50710 RepID=UPI0026360CEE|nr:hypothetical protein [Acidocella sp.]